MLIHVEQRYTARDPWVFPDACHRLLLSTSLAVLRANGRSAVVLQLPETLSAIRYVDTAACRCREFTTSLSRTWSGSAPNAHRRSVSADQCRRLLVPSHGVDGRTWQTLPLRINIKIDLHCMCHSFPPRIQPRPKLQFVVVDLRIWQTRYLTHFRAVGNSKAVRGWSYCRRHVPTRPFASTVPSSFVSGLTSASLSHLPSPSLLFTNPCHQHLKVAGSRSLALPHNGEDHRVTDSR